MTVFHEGDYVRIHDYGPSFDGRTGHLRPQLHGYHGTDWTVSLDDGEAFYATNDVIELIDPEPVAETPVDAW